jgi:phosphate transport system protein
MTDIRRGFHEELRELNDGVIRLAALVSQAIENGTDAFLRADLTAAERVIAADAEIDELTGSIEDAAFQLLALQQPMAVDLRNLVTIIRAIHEIERIGDNMVNIVKAARRLYPHQLDPKVRGLIQKMREQTIEQLRTAVSAFADRNVAQAAALEDMDDVMDDLQKQLFRWIFAFHDDQEDTVQQAVQLALVGRYFERMADHAVNFGTRVPFMVTGVKPGEAESGPAT